MPTSTEAFLPQGQSTVHRFTKLGYKEGSEADHVAATTTATPMATTTTTSTPPANAAVFKPWPEARVTSHGDYVQDLYLEEHIGGPLYASQNTVLPRLPLSSLEDTKQRLVPTVVSLAHNDKERQAFEETLESFCKQAQPYHERLQERQVQAQKKNSSWLQSLWQPLIYLQYRDPLPHYVTYFLLVPDDDKLKDSPSSGTKRGAAILHAVMESRQVIGSGRMAPDMAGTDTLCSVGFKYLFHACRIPQPQQDAYHLYDPARFNHVVVACRGQFYAVQVVDDEENPLPLPVLEARLERVRALANEQQDWPQLGWATSLHRDAWTSLREEWIQNDSLKAALEKLQSGAFLLALDDEVRIVEFRRKKILIFSSHCSLLVFVKTNTGTYKFDRGLYWILAWG